MKWSHLRLPWVDLDWLLDISCQITELDLSANCLPSLPSIIPWGLINLKKLNLSDNHLGELPCVQSSDEIICSRWAQERGQGPPYPLSKPPSRAVSLIEFGVLGSELVVVVRGLLSLTQVHRSKASWPLVPYEPERSEQVWAKESQLITAMQGCLFKIPSCALYSRVARHFLGW